jgi:hypothetical protein
MFHSALLQELRYLVWLREEVRAASTLDVSG